MRFASVISALALLALIPAASANNLMGEAVVLRALDKVTAKTQDFTVPVGDSLDYGSLRVDVKHCEKRPPEDIPETYVFLQIFDAKLDGKGEVSEPEKVFSGWMMGSNPALSALDHGVYDIWVLECKTKAASETDDEF
ncbi:DUF2155 domain-containing protein [Fretibacter rubidus]|uniref:DUF2155 domain-containing protein n=1 Tax=Fretibacter rubidus TaxID=570162 RepID=UPI003529DCF2